MKHHLRYVVAAAAFGTAVAARAAVYYCSPDGTKNGKGTLDDPYDAPTAVGKAQNGDEVRFLDGTYYLTVPAAPVTSWSNGVFTPASGTTFRGWIKDGDRPALGSLRDKVVLDTQQTGRCFHMENSGNWMVIRDMVITNACPAWRESDKYAYFCGGGVYLNGSSEALVTNCAFRGCVSKYSTYGKGAGAHVAGSARIVDCEFTGCTGVMYGLALSIMDNAVGRNCRVFNNTINKQQSDAGGMVYMNGGFLYDSFVTNNVSESEGGGIDAHGAFCCSNVIFAANVAKHWGGGGAIVRGTGLFVDCVFEKNRADPAYGAERSTGGAGALVMGSLPVFSNCTFRANTTPCYGAAIHSLASNPTIDTCGFRAYGCTFADNVAGYSGGAIRMMSYSDGLGLFGCTFTNNIAAMAGGAVRVEGPYPSGSATRLPVVGCVFVDNVATNQGGAISAAADDWAHHGFIGGFTNCVFKNNRAYHGGAVYAMGRFKNCIFDGNRAASLTGSVGDSKGGAIHMQANGSRPGSGVMHPDATNGLHCTDCVFVNNYINFQFASAVYCQYLDSTFTRCDFIGNLCDRSVSGNAGAIGVTKDVTALTVDGCRFIANKAPGYGAAISMADDSTSKLGLALIRNSLFACNTNTTSAGGAVFAVGKTKFESCTFARNVAKSEGAGLYVNHDAGSSVTNCLFFENAYNGSTTAAKSDIAPDAVRNGAVGHSFAAAGNLPEAAEAHNINGGDPMFMGAHAGDWRLWKDSPCVDTGLNQDWMTGARDLQSPRKVPRIFNGTVDIGCCECRPVRGAAGILR